MKKKIIKKRLFVLIILIISYILSEKSYVEAQCNIKFESSVYYEDNTAKIIVNTNFTDATPTPSEISIQVKNLNNCNPTFKEVTIVAGYQNGQYEAFINLSNNIDLEVKYGDVIEAKFEGCMKELTINDINSPYVLGDLNNDEYQDLIAEKSGKIVIYYGSEIGFTEGETITTVNEVYSVDIADINNDQYLDVIAGENKTVEIFINDGNGNFVSIYQVSTAKQNKDVKFNDYNNDGLVDFIASGGGKSSSLTLYKNLGNNEFEENQKIDIQHKVDGDCIKFADLTNNQYADIVVNGQIFWNNEGIYEDSGYQFASQNPISVEIIDINNDKNLDIIIGDIGCGNSSDNKNQRACIYIIENHGNKQFEVKQKINIKEKVNDLLVGDFDNDGNYDIYVGTKKNEPNYILYGDGTGIYNYEETSSKQKSILDSKEVKRAVTGDITTKDYDLDIISGSESEGVFIFYNNISSYHPNEIPKKIEETYVIVEGKNAEINWSESYDYEAETAITYDLMVGTEPGKDDIIHTEIGPYNRSPRFGKNFYNLKKNLNNLAAGTYYYKIAAIDTSYERSEWSNENYFIIDSSDENEKYYGSNKTESRNKKNQNEKITISDYFYDNPFNIEKITNIDNGKDFIDDTYSVYGYTRWFTNPPAGTYDIIVCSPLSMFNKPCDFEVPIIIKTSGEKKIRSIQFRSWI